MLHELRITALKNSGFKEDHIYFKHDDVSHGFLESFKVVKAIQRDGKYKNVS